MKKPFKETKFGKLLQSKGFDAALDVAEAVGVPGAKAINAAKDWVLNDPSVPAETKEEIEEAANNALEELDILLNDIQNSREANVRIQDSENASWLAKNVGYIIDLTILSVWAFLTIYIIARLFNIIKSVGQPDLTGVLGIYSGVTALASQIINWHRGSSLGSVKKDQTILRLTGKK